MGSFHWKNERNDYSSYRELVSGAIEPCVSIFRLRTESKKVEAFVTDTEHLPLQVQAWS